MTNVVRLFSVAILGLVAVASAAAQPIAGVEPARDVPGSSDGI